jgi:HEAT repeat protein
MNNGDLEMLIERFMSMDETSCEAEAIALGEKGDAGLPVLTELLRADEEDVRFWAVRGVWANGSPAAIDRLAESLQDESEMVRSGAAYALGRLKAETTIEALARLLTDDPSDSGNHAADALAKIGQPAARVLIEAVQNKRAWVRARAAKALIPIESRQAIRVLFEALEDESYLVRYYAEMALERMGVGQMVYFRV